MQLTPHTRANREFFAKGAAPSRAQWLDWVDRGVVQGAIIDGKPWIDANWFAANAIGGRLEPLKNEGEVTGMKLLYG